MILLWLPGFVIAKNKSTEDKHIWQARAKFSSVAFWNHDSLPSKDDSCLRAFHLLTVSNAVNLSIPLGLADKIKIYLFVPYLVFLFCFSIQLHKPVTPEELAALREN